MHKNREEREISFLPYFVIIPLQLRHLNQLFLLLEYYVLRSKTREGRIEKMSCTTHHARGNRMLLSITTLAAS